MTKTQAAPPAKKTDPPQKPLPRPPVSLVDGIPDVSANRPRWKYLLVVGLFVVWVGVLVTLWAWGGGRIFQ